MYILFYCLGLQRLQVDLLKVLLTNSDGTDKRPSSRSLFLRKFRVHVRDVIRVSVYVCMN